MVLRDGPRQNDAKKQQSTKRLLVISIKNGVDNLLGGC
jgi:hypothetical protein